MSGSVSGAARVLAALRERPDEALSGEALSRHLGVTRAQIWKHVSSLRKRGYEIDGERGGGYRLRGRPDRLYAEEVQPGLGTRWLGQRYEHLDETDSTNRVAFELGREGAPAGTTVVAESQTAGRGRLGRTFYSPPSQNLYASILLRPTGSIADAPTLILGAAVAVAETVAQQLGDEEAVEIKWPNDVLIRRRKTSGILMESSTEGTHIAFAVLGIGINLNVDRQTFPQEFRALATSLSSELGRPVDRIAFTRALLQRLEVRLDQHAARGFESLRPRFEAFFRMRGEPVGIEELGGGRIEGLAHGIAANGALEVEPTSGERAGEILRVMAGDVTLAKRAPDAR
ncbi:MAG: biotin--[acetyl-CoA-carboxylase] ligase [Deltaproteobacteria bacterium]|jgi:BirA family biotin operon repressor/biotin-[acetyl-CoA-carboxylase] ligase|nr:biotin--[acetyl-CoA-carboxylase] ligase [Deltaproteobacteria bacterium]